MLVIGPSGGGKTTKIKEMITASLFKGFELFIYVGNNNVNNVDKTVPVNTMAAAYCSGREYEGFDYTNIENCAMAYYPRSEIEKLLTTLHGGNEKNTLIVFDDCLVDKKNQQILSSFVVEAKHKNVTWIITVHNPVGENMKNFRDSATWMLFCNSSVHNIHTLTKINKKSQIIYEYETKPEKEKFLLFNTNNHSWYDVNDIKHIKKLKN